MVKREPYVPNLDLSHQGKVRDTHPVPEHNDLLLLVATDAVSTHNVVHESLVPNKGYALTALSIFFALKVLPAEIKTHIVAYGRKIYDYLPKDRTYPDDLHLRAIVVRKVDVIKIEFIRRAYMCGSLYKKYYSKKLPNPYGLKFPDDLQLMSQFHEPIFTPTDKSETDDPLNSESVTKQYPEAVELSGLVYTAGREYALRHGIEIIDFKCEIGVDAEGNLILVDEWLNSDCCRFSESHLIKVGEMPPWMDKEIFREHAEAMWNGGAKTPMKFPSEILQKGSDQYKKAVKLLTGLPLVELQKKYLS